MPSKTKSPQSRKKSAKESHKSAGSTAAAGRRGRRGVAFDIGALVSEVRDLRTLRTKYQQLLHEHNGLVGTLKDLSSELGTSARKAWDTYRGNGDDAPAVAFRSRARTSSGLVDAQYDKLVAVLPTGWTSKEEICKAAGLDPRQSNTAFRRLVTGFKRDGKNHPSRLDSNGKRGTEGRYRKK